MSGSGQPDTRRNGRCSFRPWWACVLALSLLAAGIGFAAAQIGGNRALETLPGVQGSNASVIAESGQRPLNTVLSRVPVYFIGKGNGLLYREKRDLPARGTLAETAVMALLEVAPLDSDYVSFWSPATKVRVTESGDTLIVDLPAEAFRRITSPDIAKRASAQLVNTVTEAIGGDPSRFAVQIFVDGSPVLPTVFGETNIFQRSEFDFRPAVWLTEPSNQSMVQEGTITFSGLVKPGALAPSVSVKGPRLGGQSRILSSVVGSMDAEWDTWTASTELLPGSYEVTVTTIDGGSAVCDTKTVKVVSAGQ